eukprot:CAMPEP_0114537096 /NCGR_PEP_ID=MMETSP0109-20121206/29379_1 /TAXON_ID=29199 /ORGANISM="Chlorarachnion reptans, Strain CCCM449" /LENGTH=570 /DNA_ID=CAMNT_0001720929 /DNA_START=467 /DNA_END=2179 /DNA_ORIENTATION=-
MISLLLAFTDSAGSLSLDAYFKRIGHLRHLKKKGSTPRKQSLENSIELWQIRVFQILVLIVYVYASWAKLSNYDWVHRLEPCIMWFSDRQNLKIVVKELCESLGLQLSETHVKQLIGYFFSYGGILFDGLVGPMLFHPFLRPFAFVASTGFHLTNSMLLNIGEFPIVMLGTNILFLNSKHVTKHNPDKKNVLNSVSSSSKQRKKKSSDIPSKYRWRFHFALLFIIFQLLLPLRHYMYKGDVNWYAEGHFFSWRMMLNDDRIITRFRAHQSNMELPNYPHYETEEYATLHQSIESILASEPIFLPRMGLRPRHMRRCFKDPTCLPQIAQWKSIGEFLSPRVRSHGRYQVLAEVWKGLNGRPLQRWVDPFFDLRNNATHATFHYDFLLPKIPDHAYNLTHVTKVREALLEQWDTKRFNSYELFMGNTGEFFLSSLRRSVSRERCDHTIELHCLQGNVHLMKIVFTADGFALSRVKTLRAGNSAKQSVELHVQQLTQERKVIIPENGIFVIIAGEHDAVEEMKVSRSEEPTSRERNEAKVSVWALASKCEFRHVHEALGFTSDYAVGYSHAAA